MGSNMRESSTTEYIANQASDWTEFHQEDGVAYVADLEAQMTGTRVRLWPYAPGVGYPPTQLYAVWELFEREKLWHRVFYQSVNLEELKTLERFMPWWDTRRVLLVEDLQGGGLVDLGGVIWFDDLTEGLRAHMNIVYAQRLWGAPAREASHLAMAYAFRTFNLQTLWGLTPWRQAMRHAVACGWTLHTRLPAWVRIGGKCMSLYMVTITRAQMVGLEEEGLHGL